MADKLEVVVGVDPGKSGFLCIMPLSSTIPIRFCPTPVIKSAKGGKAQYDLATLANTLFRLSDACDIRLVAIEKQQAYPGQGGASNFSTGYGYGILMMGFAMLKIPIASPHPRTWQAEMLRDIPGEDTKLRSVLAAGRLFPLADLRASERSKKPSHDKADSLLLALWARRQLVPALVIP